MRGSIGVASPASIDAPDSGSAKIGSVLCIVASLVLAGRGPTPPIVPLPAEWRWTGPGFEVRQDTRIVVDAFGPEWRALGETLADRLEPAMGFRLATSAGNGRIGSNTIVITDRIAPELVGAEGYRLESGPSRITIYAAKPAGAFYGIQSLRQLLPAAIENPFFTPRRSWSVPGITIEDQPRFPWRGLLLDVSRHFRDKQFVKRQIDLLAYHKMNVFHWHLVDDQGWRIDIERYPKLTSVGAWRMEGGKRYGGFYTQDDIREVVDYAAKRYVTVVPEIEMPGHCNAALAAYPEYSCTGGPFQVPSLWGVFADVYCAGKEATYTFNQNVLDEVLALFPSKFIHIGGDEVPKTRWKECPDCQKKIKDEGLKDEAELQSYFIHRIDAYLDKKGRRLVGWDEILEGGLAPGATVMSWRGMGGAIEAAKMGHDVIASPTSHCYLDYPYTSISVEKSYSFEPVPPQLNRDQAKHVLGGQGNMWAELTPLPRDTDRQVFPRLSALSEVFWSPKKFRSWTDFQPRLNGLLGRLERQGVKYFIEPPRFADDTNVFLTSTSAKLQPAAPGDTVVYTLDGRDPSPQSSRYRGPIPIQRNTVVKAATLRNGRLLSKPIERSYRRETLAKPGSGPATRQPGYLTRIYEGTWDKVPNFDGLQPVSTSVALNLDLKRIPRPEFYGLVAEAWVMAPEAGVYSFFLTSDDGSKLWVGDRLTVDNDGLHAPLEKSGQVALAKGWHRIRIDFFQKGGGRTLDLTWIGPRGGPKKPVPAFAVGR